MPLATPQAAPRPLLVFDLDGTLVDSAPDLLATLDHVMRAHGYGAPDLDAARDGIGHGARHLIEFALHREGAAPPSAAIDRMHRDFLARYEAHICDATRPYPGLDALFERFAASGWAFAICTNKLEHLSRQVIAALGLDARFAANCGGDTFPTRKPDPGHLLGTIARAGGEPGRAIMVGDSRTDLDAARAAGIPFVGVPFGYTPVPMAEMGPDLLAAHYDELTLAAAEALLARRGGALAP